MAVLSPTSTVRSDTSKLAASEPSKLSKPPLTRSSTQRTTLPGSGVTITRRAPSAPNLDPWGPVPHALPLFRSLKHATAMRRFDNGNIPFFFLQSKDPYVTPLSGLLNPRQPPPAPLPPRDASIGARFEADAATFSDLNDALQLQDADGTLVMHQHNVDGNYTREITLGPWRALTYDARASAIIGCFLRLSPARSWYLTDSELLSYTMAAACLMAGCLVRRDLTAAEALVARIPLEDRRRAQTLTRDYIEQHDLWPLKDYMEPEAGLLGDTELPPAWNQPRRWPGLVKGMALWLLDVSLLDQDD